MIQHVATEWSNARNTCYAEHVAICCAEVLRFVWQELVNTGPTTLTCIEMLRSFGRGFSNVWELIYHICRKKSVLKFRVKISAIQFSAVCGLVLRCSLKSNLLQLNWSVFLDKCFGLRLRDVTGNFSYKDHLDKFHCLG